MSSPSEQAASGLRERKKARNKAEIRRHALRLFAEHGYDGTTMEDVARAAEMSVSTVFRYFPTKEDLVITDDFGPRIAEAFIAQPAELSPIKALRAAFQELLADVSEADLAAKHQRELLAISVPQLWTASLDSINNAVALLRDLVAQRAGRATDDVAVRSAASAAFGVMLAVWLEWADQPDMDAAAVLDARLAELEGWDPFSG